MRNFVHCVYCPIPESILIYMVLPQNCSLTVKTPRNLKRDSHLFSHKWKILRFRPRLNIVCRTFTSDKQWHFSKGVEMNLDTFCWKNKQTLGWSLRCIFFFIFQDVYMRAEEQQSPFLVMWYHLILAIKKS